MFARHGAATVSVCLLITLVLTLAGSSTWDVNLVYSLSIGLLSWLVIELGRLRFAQNRDIPWPQGWRGMIVVLAGVLIGFGVGSLIGQSYQRYVQPDAHPEHFDLWLLPMIITVVTSALMSFVYYVVGKSRYLELQAAQAEKQATEARLTLLQTQLEPHMLFNTLANLRVLIAADPERAQMMLDHLIDYLRATLGSSRNAEHALRDEFARLHDYLALMQIRMGKRLTFTLDLPDALSDICVPPLLLQPLVENSIRHGLEPQVQGGAIVVTARECLRAQQPFVELTVSDTGVGQAHNASPTNPRAGQPFGTAQVRERLATRYGDEATFELTARAPESGTLARIVFPLIRP
ncbi:sensor histidine kinase [Diaphorobacter sp. HDW4A]|uniref:sensor histidine kinase n=1 Tax=Diaphorobacter sp. HDW4A TaxID=2714924 RepID=UPI001F0EAE8D|nr:histidine kinase [Diaphorobacter sp. HDW4A]